MTYMLDTNICIYVIKHKPEQVFQHMQENLQKRLCILAITLAELEHEIESMREAFGNLKADEKLHHDSGTFDYGDWGVWL